jgi:hypothetical protein
MPFGNGPDKGTQVAVFIQLLPGEYDDRLKWPFQGEITVRLIGQGGWTSDWEKKILFLKTTPIDSSGRVAEGELGTPVGHYNFIPHSYNIKKYYITEGSLWFHIKFEQSHD